jgi:mRNA-degrading endonuclease RelE of RelBE toxin-antitoxin system
MQFESTAVFDRDCKKLDRNERKLLKEIIEKIAE